MMALEKIASLIQRLDAKTEGGTLEWDETHRDRFRAKVGNHQVAVSVAYSAFDPEQDPDYFFSLENADGHSIDYVSDRDLQKYLPNAYLSLKSLYDQARRQARNISSLVDEIVAELEKGA